VQGITITESVGGPKLRKLFLFYTFWILHWFISRSSVVLGLWNLIYGSGSSEVCWTYCDGTYWLLV